MTPYDDVSRRSNLGRGMRNVPKIESGSAWRARIIGLGAGALLAGCGGGDSPSSPSLVPFSVDRTDAFVGAPSWEARQHE